MHLNSSPFRYAGLVQALVGVTLLVFACTASAFIIHEQQVVGKWRSCGTTGCTICWIRPDRTFQNNSATTGALSYLGTWRIEGNELLMRISRANDRPRMVNRTMTFVVTDINDREMHTTFLRGDTRKHLWQRVR